MRGFISCGCIFFMCRFAFSVIWEMSENAKILNTKYMKSIIFSRVSAFIDELGIYFFDKTRGACSRER